MNEATIQRLIDINRQFYQTFALQFSKTRQRLQPGVQQILRAIPGEARLLDLGCGNGELWRALAKRGHSGPYIGLDFSPGLLAEARNAPSAAVEKENPGVSPVFIQTDLTSTDWDAALSSLSPDIGSTQLSVPLHFDFIFAFAVLHHIPDTVLRRRIIEKARNLLKPEGKLIHSVWQFLNSDRLQSRIQPWEKAGLKAEDVETGDYLLDWRQGGEGLRYVHHFSEDELAMLAHQTGFNIKQTFLSDGEGGNLGLYQVWEVK